MRRHALVLVAILGLAAFAGCDVGGPAETTGTGGDTAPPVEDSSIVFRFSGGIEGRDDVLVVEPDGTATVTPGFGDFEYMEQLSVEEVAELQRLLDGSGLFTRDQTFEGDIVDDFAFAITYRGVTVAGDESASPGALDPARGRLTDLLDSILASGIDSTQELPPLGLTLELAFESGAAGGLEVITGHLYLQTAASGQLAGALSASIGGAVRVVEVSGRLEAGVATLDPGEAAVDPEGTLAWDSWEMNLEDADGDGTVDSATGRVAGTWTQFIGDVVEGGDYEATLTAALDHTEAHAVIGAPSTREFLLPSDEIGVAFDEPVRDVDIYSATPTLLADGQVVDGYLSFLDTGVVDGLVGGATFLPRADLPFGAQVTIDVGGLVDPSGNAVTWEGESLPTAPDPGSLGDNAGFEAGLEGWIPFGTVEAVDGFEGLAPEEGEAFAVVREQSSLAGYVDVPADAETLEFSVAVFSEAGMFDAGRSAVISLSRGAGSGFAIFDAAEHAGESVACDECTTELSERIGPLRQRIDIRSYQGQRMYVIVDVRSAFFFGVNYFAVVLDDFRLE